MTPPRRLRDDRGTTLVELVVAVLLLGVLSTMATGTVVGSLRTERRQAEEVDAVNTARVAFERLTRDVRAANPLTAAGADAIAVRVLRGDVAGGTVTRTVTFALASGTLRTDATGGAAAPTVLLRGVANDAARPLFTYLAADGTPIAPAALGQAVPLADVASVGIRLRVALESGRTLDLTSDVALRNLESPL